MAKSERAFTIVEILIVISIIGILAALTMTGLSVVVKNSKVALSKTLIKNLEVAIEQYQNDRGHFPFDELDKLGQKPILEIPKVLGCATLVEAFDGDGWEDHGIPYFSLKREQVDKWKKLFISSSPETSNNVNLLDIWGRPIHYRQNQSMRYKYTSPAETRPPIAGAIDEPDPATAENCIFNPNSFDLWSDGPDMKSGTDDDIGNWD